MNGIIGFLIGGFIIGSLMVWAGDREINKLRAELAQCQEKK